MALYKHFFFFLTPVVLHDWQKQQHKGQTVSFGGQLNQLPFQNAANLSVLGRFCHMSLTWPRCVFLIKTDFLHTSWEACLLAAPAAASTHIKNNAALTREYKEVQRGRESWWAQDCLCSPCMTKFGDTVLYPFTAIDDVDSLVLWVTAKFLKDNPTCFATKHTERGPLLLHALLSQSLKAWSTLGHLKPRHKYSFKLLLAFSFWACDLEMLFFLEMITCCQHFLAEKATKLNEAFRIRQLFFCNFRCRCNFLHLHALNKKRGGGKQERTDSLLMSF